MQKNLGRIKDIIEILESKQGQPVQRISEQTKLDALCDTLQLEPEKLDNLIFENSPVMRTVRGHAFESYFDVLMSSVGEKIERIGGDNAIDRIARGHSLQLKTPYSAGTKGSKVSYKSHKTHGAKSERESMDYYHDVRQFADFLVGLISYYPFNILILNKSELPRHPKDQNKILSPFEIEWADHPGLNAWDRLGISAPPSSNNLLPKDNELLPKTAEFLGMNSEIILNTILSLENFRIWDMSIRGFAREVVFTQELKDREIDEVPPGNTGKDRADKSDYAIKCNSDGKYKFFQMKGASVNNCKFNGKNSKVATETQLTRGRVNDHPTQSRLYLHSDFDYLVLGLDPSLGRELDVEIGGTTNRFEWKFYCIPVSDLERHHEFRNRLKSLQVFKYCDMEKYRVTSKWFDLWSKKL